VKVIFLFLASCCVIICLGTDLDIVVLWQFYKISCIVKVMLSVSLQTFVWTQGSDNWTQTWGSMMEEKKAEADVEGINPCLL
jgi:hypothetical protein